MADIEKILKDYNKDAIRKTAKGGVIMVNIEKNAIRKTAKGGVIW